MVGSVSALRPQDGCRWVLHQYWSESRVGPKAGLSFALSEMSEKNVGCFVPSLEPAPSPPDVQRAIDGAYVLLDDEIAQRNAAPLTSPDGKPPTPPVSGRSGSRSRRGGGHKTSQESHPPRHQAVVAVWSGSPRSRAQRAYDIAARGEMQRDAAQRGTRLRPYSAGSTRSSETYLLTAPSADGTCARPLPASLPRNLSLPLIPHGASVPRSAFPWCVSLPGAPVHVAQPAQLLRGPRPFPRTPERCLVFHFPPADVSRRRLVAGGHAGASGGTAG